MALDSRKTLKKTFLTCAFTFFVLFSLQFHEASTMIVLKNFQTLYKRTLCEHSLYPYAKNQ